MTPPPTYENITVRACKFDGSVHRTWRATLREQNDELIVLDAVFETEVIHPLLGHIERGTISTEYYWTNRWYNIFRFDYPDGTLRNFYCNIACPARLAGESLTFIDLDIDVLVHTDFTFATLDKDEFAINAQRYDYSKEIQHRARETQIELARLIESRGFPFSIITS